METLLQGRQLEMAVLKIIQAETSTMLCAPASQVEARQGRHLKKLGATYSQGLIEHLISRGSEPPLIPK